jgi:hypothetical protein
MKVGDRVCCEWGDGEILTVDQEKCTIQIQGQVRQVNRFQVIPFTEPHAGHHKNPSCDLMRRTAKKLFSILDILIGEQFCTLDLSL